MEQNRIKQRIVGGIILVSIAVIVLPMILNESGEREISASNIPQQPDYLIKTEIIPLEIKKRPDPANKIQRRVVQEAPEDLTKESVKAPAEVISAPVEVAKEVSQSVEIKPPSEPEKKTLVSGWVVQVGSFSNHLNATTLRDRLRNSGYTAFVERVDSGKVIYRVRVGPTIKEAEAQTLKSILKEEMALDGLVIRHR